MASTAKNLPATESDFVIFISEITGVRLPSVKFIVAVTAVFLPALKMLPTVWYVPTIVLMLLFAGIAGIAYMHNLVVVRVPVALFFLFCFVPFAFRSIILSLLLFVSVFFLRKFFGLFER